MAVSLAYEVVPTDTIRPFQDNPRKHSRKQIGALVNVISGIGFTNPLLIDEAGELIAGHGRLLAAQKLGLQSLPTIRLSGLTPAQARALRIADNKLAEGSTWDIVLLTEQLELTVKDDFDVTLTGFDGIEVERLLTGDVEDPDDEPSLAPPPEHPLSRLGDLWACGNSLVLCANSCEAASYQMLLGQGSADLVITDVPYNVPVAGHVSSRGKHAEFAMASGEMSPDQFSDFLLLVLGHVRTVARDGALVYVFIDWRSIAELIAVGRRLFTELKNVITWVKPNAGMGSFYRSQHELIAVFKHGRGKHCNNIQLGRMGRFRSNVWQYPGASGFSKSRKADLDDHPTVKPVRLVADAIRDASMPGDLVLDPFGGAGTTLLAAEQVGRRAALIEIEPRYVDVTLRRFQEQTGTEPLLMPDRVPLSTVRAERLSPNEVRHG